MARSAKPRAAARKPRAAARPAAPPPVTYSRALVATQLAKVRAFCGSLPDVVERPSHGSPAFLIRGKTAFAYFLDNHHADGRLALWCAAPDGAQAMLVDANPDHYFIPPYVAHLGWIGMRLDRKAPWPEIAAVLETAHQTRYTPARTTRPRR